MYYSRAEINKAQCTLGKPVHGSGVGLNYGDEVSLSLLPAPPDSGTHFLRRDVDITRALIPASLENIAETDPDTLLDNEHGIGVHGVETLLAALRGCGVDNVVIEVDGYELPDFDGSSMPLLQMIHRAGVVAQPAARQIIWVDRQVAVRIGEHYASIRPGRLPSITVDDAPDLRSQRPLELSFSLLDHIFEREIAPARSPQHLAAVEKRDTARLLPPDTAGPRFEDEFMRYRALESIGLLALAQMPVYGQMYFYKPRAFLAEALMRKLFAMRDSWRQLSYAEIEQITGSLAPASYQQIPDRRIISSDPLIQ